MTTPITPTRIARYRDFRFLNLWAEPRFSDADSIKNISMNYEH